MSKSLAAKIADAQDGDVIIIYADTGGGAGMLTPEERATNLVRGMPIDLRPRHLADCGVMADVIADAIRAAESAAMAEEREQIASVLQARAVVLEVRAQEFSPFTDLRIEYTSMAAELQRQAAAIRNCSRASGGNGGRGGKDNA